MRRVTVPAGRPAPPAGPDPEADAVLLGQKARELAAGARAAAGFDAIERSATIGDLGIDVDFRARDSGGQTWLFDLCGAFSTTRPGLRRPDVLWRALGKASVIHQARSDAGGREDLGPLVLLTTDLPGPRSAGGKALRAVRREDGTGPVRDVIELLDREGSARLRTYATGSQAADRPSV
jgi:site-specific DNA-methyltransferase (adenine-specific)